MSEQDKPKVKLRKEYAVPKEIGAALDLLGKIGERRSVLAAKEKEEGQQERLVEEIILKRFDKSKLEGARSRRYVASVERKDYPTILPGEGAKLDRYVLKTGDLELFQRRLNVTACRERFANKKAIPGVGVFTKVSVKLTRR